MKKALYALFTMTLLFSVYRCGEEEEIDFSPPNRGEFYNSRWMSISDIDSLKIDFGFYKDSFNTNCFRLDKYELKNGTATYTGYDIYKDWLIDGDNMFNLFYTNSYSPQKNDKKYRFDLSNGKLTIYNFYKNRDIIFYQEKYSSTNIDNNLIAGDWVKSSNRDSTALVFKNETMKEYIYEKNTGNIIKYTEYNWYELKERTYSWKDRIIKTYHIIAYNWSSKSEKYMTYILDNNKLTIYQNDYPVIYTKIE